MGSIKKERQSGRQAVRQQTDRQHKGFNHIITEHKPQETLDQNPVKRFSFVRTGSNSTGRKEEAAWVGAILRKDVHSLHIFLQTIFLDPDFLLLDTTFSFFASISHVMQTVP